MDQHKMDSDQTDPQNTDSQRFERLSLASEMARETQHEFNNVLAAAFGYTNLLIRRGGEADIGEHLLKVLERANNLLEQFFLLVRDGDGEPEQFDFRELVDDLIVFFGIFPANRLVLSSPIERPLLIEANRRGLFFALVQHFYYLRDHLQTDITLSAIQTDDVESRIILSIGGFDAVIDSDMFPEAARQIIESAGGRLLAQRIEFEAYRPPTDSSDLVLLVDSDRYLLETNKQILETLGYTVLDVSDGLLALDIFEKQPESFSRVVAGDSLTSVDSASLLMRIKALRPGIRTIFCGSQGECRNADGYITSPLSTDHWRQVLTP
jgi:CheY-like chemotaxis protein